MRMETSNMDSGSIDFEVPSWDTREVFAQWVQCLEPQAATEASEPDVVFDGVLRVDGLVKGSVRSAHGTLVMTEQGHIRADVDVRVAYIDGFLEGSLRATEEVVLNRNARVAGDIYTPSLSIKDGAVFEGKSFVLERTSYGTVPEGDHYSNVPNSRLVGAYRQQMRRDQDNGLQFGYKARQ
jgi:cytoskeletal protein CcmA (bactofilin family)